MKLLHLDSSIQGAASVSRTISAAIVARLRENMADLDVTYRDLVKTPIDHLSLAALGDAETDALIAEFLTADIVVIGAPLYNFTVSTQLKAWIDRLLIAGRTFRYTRTVRKGWLAASTSSSGCHVAGYMAKRLPTQQMNMPKRCCTRFSALLELTTRSSSSPKAWRWVKNRAVPPSRLR